MTKYLPILSLFMVYLCLSSCKHDRLDTPTPILASDTLWRTVAAVNYDKTILNTAFSTDSSLYLVGNNYHLEVNKNEQLVSSTLISKAGLGFSYSDDPYMNAKYTVYQTHGYYQNTELTIRENARPNIKTTIDISQIDTNYMYINGRNFCAINDKNQLIVSIAYRKWQNPNRVSYDSYFLIFDLQTAQDSVAYRINKLIKVPDSRAFTDYQPTRIYQIYPVEDNFYFSGIYANLQFVNITSGSSSVLSPYLYGDFLTVKDTLHIIGYGKNIALTMYSKPLKAPNTDWLGYTLTDLSYNGYQFRSIDDKFIFFWSYQLWELSLSADKKYFSIKELKNYGLNGVSIQDVCLFNNKVYLATSNGLFTKPLKTFFTYK